MHTAPTNDHPRVRAGAGEPARRLARRRRVFTAFARTALVAAVVVTASAAAWHVELVRVEQGGYVAAMARDLLVLADIQRAHRAATGRFGTIQELGRGYVPSQGVSVVVTSAGEGGWAATATHVRSSTSCVLTVPDGSSSPRPACL